MAVPNFKRSRYDQDIRMLVAVGLEMAMITSGHGTGNIHAGRKAVKFDHEQ